MVMISLAVGAIATKFFGKKRHDDEGGQGDHPVVRAMFLAVNTGEGGDLRKLLHPDLRVYLNDYPVLSPGFDHGPMLILDAIDDLRRTLPDVHWELYDELTGEDQGDEKIAIRFSSTYESSSETIAFSVAGFGLVRDDQLIEWRQVADLDTYETHRASAHRPPLAPSADDS